MARTPKPKTQQADGVLDDAAPVAPLAQAAEAAAALAADAPQATHVDPPDLAAVFRVVVRALQPVRRRVGRVFTPEPVEIDVAGLTPGQIEALQGDPMLAVTVLG